MRIRRKIICVILICCFFVSGKSVLADTVTVSRPLSNVVKIIGAKDNSIALMADGTLWVWGKLNGHYINGKYEKIETPTQIPGGTDIIDIGAGASSIVALKEDGTVCVWSNDQSFLQDINSPFQLEGLSNIKKISVGIYFGLALKEDGTVWAWGSNDFGQRGNGTMDTIPFYSVNQVQVLTDIIEIDAGWHHALAIKDDGTVWSWGNHSDGQLGRDTYGKTEVAQVPGLSNIQDIEAGSYHSMVLKEDGTVWAFGNNNSLQLGKTGGNAIRPIQIQGLIDIKKISSGLGHGMALKNDETVWAWGENSRGQVGDGILIDRADVYKVEDLEGISSISLGSDHNLVLKNGGTVWAWGSNSSSQVGDGSRYDAKKPVQVMISVSITTPTSPTNVLTSSNNAKIGLTWDAVSEAQTYIVKKANSSGGQYTTIAENIQNNNYSDTDVVNQQTYYYVIVAKNEAGESPNSAEVSGTPQEPLSPPTVPTNLVATSGNQSVSITWDNILNANSYSVKRSTTSGGNFTTIASDITSTSYTDTDLTNGTTYYYVIIAKNEAGEGEESTEVSATPVQGLPSNPTNLEAVSTNKSITLTWSSVSSASSYKIKRKIATDGEYTEIANNITETTYEDNNLTKGDKYYYVVTAVNEVGESSYSNEVMGSLEEVKPDSPTDIETIVGDKAVAITWSPIDNAESYILKRSLTQSGPYSLVAEDITANTYTDSGLTNGTSYYYVIIAKNAKGESAPSTEIEVVPGTQAPTNILIEERDNTAKISWDIVEGASTYKIKRSDTIDGTYTVIKDGITGSSYIDNTIMNNKRYYYVISAINAIGESPESYPVYIHIKNSEKERYKLLVTLINGMQKEYDINSETSIKFIKWYMNRANGIGAPFFTLFNEQKQYVYGNSKDYIGFNTILYYQLNEYKIEE